MMQRAKATLVSVLVLAGTFLGASPATAASAAGSGLPTAPTNVVASANPGSAKVRWNPPADDGGAAISGYVVTPYKAGVAQTARAFSSTKLFQRITGLANNAQYAFTVAAANANGIGSPSPAMTPITVGFRRAPTAPTALSTVPGDGQVVLTWAAPSSSGSASVTRYLVTPYLDGEAAPVRAYDASTTTQIVTGLTNGSTYRFTVIAESAAGKSPPSAMSDPVTVGAVRPNTAPVATADLFTAYEDTPMEVAAPGILANDTDADDDPLQIELVSYPGGFVDAVSYTISEPTRLRRISFCG
jgi:predicted phage tail protein